MISTLTAVNPYTGQTDRLLVQMADQTGMKMLHMHTTGDPTRNPSFVFFADPNYFITDFPANTCETCINPLFAWNHGDVQVEIANTWAGFVGPGVKRRGQDDTTWTDHADVRPTILALLGLKDTYGPHDGRALIETMELNAQPVLLGGQHAKWAALAAAYKQINAPFGQLALDSLKVSTAALTSNSQSDLHYITQQGKIGGWTLRRDALASEMKKIFDGVTFNGQIFDGLRAGALIEEALALLVEARLCAISTSLCR